MQFASELTYVLADKTMADLSASLQTCARGAHVPQKDSGMLLCRTSAATAVCETSVAIAPPVANTPIIALATTAPKPTGPVSRRRGVMGKSPPLSRAKLKELVGQRPLQNSCLAALL